MRLVLSSTSPYRRILLERLGLPFDTAAPDADETRLPGEAPETLVRRLSESKARAVAARFPDALIIGSDQVAVIDGDVIGKPGGFEQAAAQLRRASGRRVSFLTGLCLFNAARNRSQVAIQPFFVHFRPLGEERIARYLQRDQPYNCAGSFKSEGLGIALFERMEGEDPSALMGLPLIRLTTMLEAEGVAVV